MPRWVSRVKVLYIVCSSVAGAMFIFFAKIFDTNGMLSISSSSVSVRMRDGGIMGIDFAPEVSGVAKVRAEKEKYVFGSFKSWAVMAGLPL